MDLDAIDMLGDDITMDDLVEEYFNNLEDETKQMSVLSVKRMGAAVKSYITKDDKQAVEFLVMRQREKIGGDWAVANVVYSREIRDKIR